MKHVRISRDVIDPKDHPANAGTPPKVKHVSSSRGKKSGVIAKLFLDDGVSFMARRHYGKLGSVKTKRFSVDNRQTAEQAWNNAVAWITA